MQPGISGHLNGTIAFKVRILDDTFVGFFLQAKVPSMWESLTYAL